MRAIAFSGGKESTILLFKYWKKGDIVFTITEQKPFPEVTKYINYIADLFSLNILEFSDFESAFNELKHMKVELLISGQRNSDPKGPECAYRKTDWSDPIVCYNPLFDWSYKDVWEYIDFHNLPVCSLYQKGYTSLGEIDKTFQNYDLYQIDTKTFIHARNLPINSDERESRIRNRLPIEFSGKVIRGKGLGKQLGFPTANVVSSPNLQSGVYYGICRIFEETQPMVMSIGTNPMFGDTTVEIHILKEYEQDFYGEILSVTVTGFIRKMRKYNSLEFLIKDINKDIVIATYRQK